MHTYVLTELVKWVLKLIGASISDNESYTSAKLGMVVMNAKSHRH